MAERLYCSKGHRWEPAFPRGQWPPNFRSACPTCGAAPIGPGDVTGPTARILIIVAVGCLVAGLIFLLVLPVPGVILLSAVANAIPLTFVAWVARSRMKKMGRIAEAMNFAFMANLAPSSVRGVAPFRLFKLGALEKAYNAMQGRVGDCDVLLVELSNTTGSGKNRHTTQLTAAILFDGAAGLPDFQLAPKTFFDKIAGFFTHNNIDIEDAGEFARRCKLMGPNESALRETFHPELVQYLGNDGRLFIEVVDGQLLVHRQIRLAPNKCPGLVTDALEVRDLLRNAEKRSP